VVNASNRLKSVDWLADSKGSFNVQIMDQTLDTCMIAVQGPKALGICAGMFEADPSKLAYYFAAPTRYQGQGCVVSRTGYTGEDGLESMINAKFGVPAWEPLPKRSPQPDGLAALHTPPPSGATPRNGPRL